ncbi:MAG: glycosyltransferase family 4 protein [Proteobacteria bacterium]|nr:glycosyltransferase family 4 protein [Pseudomonadota bacterium]
MTWFSYVLLLLGLSWAFVGIYRWYAVEKGMLDEPNERSSHYAPTPRGGGVVFFLGWVIVLIVLAYLNIISKKYLWFFSPAILIGFLGFWDDHQDLSAGLRFIIQCIGAGIGLFLVNEGGYLIQPWLTWLPLPICFLVLVVAMVWTINLFNFMDGADGIAATQGIFVFGVGGYLLFQYQAYELATLAWSLSALVSGFLLWNWPTARIFMGDSGSCFLGMMVALYAFLSYKLFQMPLMIWIILTGFFWFDATITLLRRILAGEEWRKPHRKHAYQRLIQSGWSHQKVLISYIGVNTVLAYLALLVYKQPQLSFFAFSFAVLFLLCLYILVEIVKPMYKNWHDGAKKTCDLN